MIPFEIYIDEITFQYLTIYHKAYGDCKFENEEDIERSFYSFYKRNIIGRIKKHIHDNEYNIDLSLPTITQGHRLTFFFHNDNDVPYLIEYSQNYAKFNGLEIKDLADIIKPLLCYEINVIEEEIVDLIKTTIT